MKPKKIFLALLSLLLFSSLALAIEPPAAVKADYDSQNNSVFISWDGIAGAAGYNVYRKDSLLADYAKVNSSPVTEKAYQDFSVVKGNDYLYAVKAVDAAGTESAYSTGAGAPLMTISIGAIVTTNREKPVEKKSIRTGQTVTFASPGDMITYSISYKNAGVSSANNTNINFEIPKGTTLSGSPIAKLGSPIFTYYYDQKQSKWVNKAAAEENISGVRLMVQDPIPPVKNADDVSGTVNIKVVINP